MDISIRSSRRSSAPGLPLRVGGRVGPSILILALMAALVACGSGDDTGSATTSSTSSTTSVSTSTTLAPGTSSTIADSGEDILGWVRSFETRDGTAIAQVDEAEMLTGDEALAAAREDGVIGSDEDLPNDYYIRNPDESTTELSVSPEVVVTLQVCYVGGECVTTEQVDLTTWSTLLGGEEDPGFEWSWYGQGSLPYLFTVANDLVVEVEEVYLP